MIFQNPNSHLDPVMRIGDQIAESVRFHEGASAQDARDRAIELLRQVGIPDPARRIGAFPHEFSGGMRQRAMIAVALACRPKILIADEPTTALDVTVQAQVLRLLLDLRDRLGLAIVLVTHNLGVVAQTCDTLAVMYAGRVMERGPKRDLLARAGASLYRGAAQVPAGLCRSGTAVARHSRPAAVAERVPRRLPLPSPLPARGHHLPGAAPRPAR